MISYQKIHLIEWINLLEIEAKRSSCLSFL